MEFLDRGDPETGSAADPKMLVEACSMDGDLVLWVTRLMIQA